MVGDEFEEIREVFCMYMEKKGTKKECILLLCGSFFIDGKWRITWMGKW